VSDDDELTDDDEPPSLERGGNYLCSLCGEGPGGMYSSCNNVNCEWYNKSLLEITFGYNKPSDMSSKKSVSYDDVPPTVIPPASWLNELLNDDLISLENYDTYDDVPTTVIPPESELLNDDLISLENYDTYDDVPPTVIPPASWLNCGLEFLEDEQEEEWVKISSIVNKNIPEFQDTNNYICGFCGETKRGMFSICWNISCDRYSKSIDDIYEESFNYPKDIKNVTLRNHQKAYEVSN
jgi:hypothetical protein